MRIPAFDVQKTSIFNSPAGKDENQYLAGMEKDYPGIGVWVDGMLKSGMRKISLTNAGKHKITAYTAAAADPKTIVILLHGYNGCAMQMMPYARIYLEQPGFAVLLPNFENHGESEGDKTQFGYQEKHDVDLWIKEALRLYPQATRVVLHGVSMGGATSMLCSRHPMVSAVIDDCGYSSLPAQIRHEAALGGMKPVPFTFLFSLANLFRAGWILGQVRPIKDVRRSTIPVLFIHGTKDKKVPSWMAEKLYRSKKHGRKQIWLADGAAHAKSLLTYPEQYASTIMDFIGKI